MNVIHREGQLFDPLKKIVKGKYCKTDFKRKLPRLVEISQGHNFARRICAPDNLTDMCPRQFIGCLLTNVRWPAAN